jgi:hypothetical protein
MKQSFKTTFPTLFCLSKMLVEGGKSALVQSVHFRHFRSARGLPRPKSSDAYIVVCPGASSEDYISLQANRGISSREFVVTNSSAAGFPLTRSVSFFEISDPELVHFQSILDYIGSDTFRQSDAAVALLVFKNYREIARRVRQTAGPEVLRRVCMLRPVRAVAGSPELFATWFRLFRRLQGIFLALGLLPHSRSSTVTCAMHGLMSRAAEIILYGVDGTGGKAAYQNDKYRWRADLPQKNLEGKLHSTNDPAFGRPTVTEVFEVLQSEGHNIYVGSDQSALYPSIPKYER